MKHGCGQTLINYTQDIGLETIQRQSLLTLFDNLNVNIEASVPDWISDDITYFAQIGRMAPDFTYEYIDDANFYPGIVPSLMDAVAGIIPLEVDRYPNVCTFAHRGTPRYSSDDTGDLYSNLLSVEMMVKSELSELECNARIQKLLNTVHKTILNDRNLNNSIIKANAPSVTIGDVFARIDPRDSKKKLYFQGSSLEYIIDKYVDFDE